MTTKLLWKSITNCSDIYSIRFWGTQVRDAYIFRLTKRIEIEYTYSIGRELLEFICTVVASRH